MPRTMHASEPIAAKSRMTLRDCAVLGAVAFCALLAIYVWLMHGTPPFPKDGSSLVIGRDFVNFWMYGRAAFAHAPWRFYDPHLYNTALRTFLGPSYPGQNWSYPPDIMLVAAPFGLLGYLAALACWTILGAAALFWTARERLRDPLAILALFAAPAVAFCLMSGQSSLFTAAALITVFACLDRRPICAGLLIGLMTLKPQIGLLLPVMLVASGRWRVFVVAAVAALALAILAALIFGTQSWIAYVRLGIPVQNTVLSDPRLLAAPFMPTLFMNLHAAGMSYGAAMIAQAAVSLSAAATVFWAFRRHSDANLELLQALFFACSVAATPYLLNYDTLPLVFAAVALLTKGALDTAGQRLAQSAYWLPFIQLGLGQLHIPGAALIAPAFAAYLALRIAEVNLFAKPATVRPLA